jgi:hypothetical protein
MRSVLLIARSFARAKGDAAEVLTVALGIGVNTVVFSLFDHSRGSHIRRGAEGGAREGIVSASVREGATGVPRKSGEPRFVVLERRSRNPTC